MFASLMRAITATLVSSWRLGHRLTMSDKSGSCCGFGAFGASCASDFAPPPSEIGVFDSASGVGSNPTRPSGGKLAGYAVVSVGGGHSVFSWVGAAEVAEGAVLSPDSLIAAEGADAFGDGVPHLG